MKPFLEKLLEKLNEEIHEKEVQIANGLASDWADYQHRCGILVGWRHVKDWINELQEI